MSQRGLWVELAVSKLLLASKNLLAGPKYLLANELTGKQNLPARLIFHARGRSQLARGRPTSHRRIGGSTASADKFRFAPPCPSMVEGWEKAIYP